MVDQSPVRLVNGRKAVCDGGELQLELGFGSCLRIREWGELFRLFDAGYEQQD